MITPTFDISESGRVAHASAPADDECLRYRLDVIAANAVDVVGSAGGWLYDRVMAGWEVTVLLPDSRDTRSLRILGVADLGGLRAESAPRPRWTRPAKAWPSAPRLHRRCAGPRQGAQRRWTIRSTEVALWGDGWPLGVDREMTRAQHVLSPGRRGFKGAALAAAGIAAVSVDPTETLLQRLSARSPVDSELIRLG